MITKLFGFVFFATFLVVLSSCTSTTDKRWNQYKRTTDYNQFKCQQLCSTGNVAQIQDFGCACRYQQSAPTTSTATASGNTIHFYQQPSRSVASGSSNNTDNAMAVGKALMDYGTANKSVYDSGDAYRMSPAQQMRVPSQVRAREQQQQNRNMQNMGKALMNFGGNNGRMFKGW